jgi:hypothetical protein
MNTEQKQSFKTERVRMENLGRGFIVFLFIAFVLLGRLIFNF